MYVVQIRPQRIIGKQRLPHPWSELMNLRGRMLADRQQHVDKIRLGIGVMAPADRQKTLHDTDVFGAHLGPGEQPVGSPHQDDP